MSRITPQIKHFALRLMTHETKGTTSHETITTESFRVFEKLQPQLAVLMGNGGFRALLTRALALAKADVSWLNMVRVTTDGTLDASGGFGTQVTPEQLIEGYSVLLGQLLGLMVTLVGEKITLGLLREVWPKIKISDSEFENQGAHENSK